jgi:manganese/iron transport system ATP-binding protein
MTATSQTSLDLSVKNVSVAYSNGHVALHNASFTLGPGTICALVGVNGSGKSTLFKSIMGFLRPARGSVTICGEPVHKAHKKSIVAYVPQAEEVDWSFPVTVRDVVMMGRYGYMNFLRIARAEDHRIVEESLARVQMLDFAHRQIGELSGGQKKRVFIARALAQRGRIILLDEPFTGVDVQTELAIIELMRELRQQGHIILVSTHNLGAVPDFCDQVVLINRTVLAFGPTATTFTQENLARTFGASLKHLRLDHTDNPADARNELVVVTDDEQALVLGSDGQLNRLPEQEARP